MEAIQTLFNKLQNTVTPRSGAIRLPEDDDRISLWTVNDEPYQDEDDSDGIQNDTPRVQFNLEQLYSQLRLDPSTKSIRVLDIDPPHPRDPNGTLRGTLRVVHLSDCPAFTALSYTWGPYSSPAVDTIRCNGSCDVPITKNGRDALLALRNRHYAGRTLWKHSLPLTIWVDAVCINQSDDTEKASQIALMSEVYTWAQTVWVWLGNGDERTARAVKGLKKAAELRIEPVGVPWIGEDMYRYAAANHNGAPRSLARYKVHLAMNMIRVFLRTFWRFLWGIPQYFISICGSDRKSALLGSGDIDCLLDREWMERAWTFQEIVLASNPIIVCGEEAISWAQLQQGLDCLDQMRPSFAGSDNIRSVSAGGPFGLAEVRYYLFKGWAISRDTDIRTREDWQTYINQTVGKSGVSQRWSNLFRVWRMVSRPTSWNGRAFRSVPKLNEPAQSVDNNSRTGASEGCISVKEYENQFNTRRIWSRARLLVLLPYIGFMAFLLYFIVVPFTPGFDPFGSDPFAPGFDPHRGQHMLSVFIGFGVASFLIALNFIPFIIYIGLAMCSPTIGGNRHDTGSDDIYAPTSSGLVAIIRVLRDRKAQEAHDKSFATHGVLSRLGISVPQPDYKKPLGKVYHELYTELIKREPSCIALLADVKGSILPGAPSWVPDWGSPKLHWTREEAIYSRIEAYPSSKRADSDLLVKWNSSVSEEEEEEKTEIVVRGLFIGELSYTSQPIGGSEEEGVNGTEPVSLHASLTAIDAWRREVVALYARQTPPCEYNPSSVSLTLRNQSSSSSSPANKEEWIEEDFRRWHKILTTPGYDSSSSSSSSSSSPQSRQETLINFALSEREFQSRRFTEYICRAFGGTASLFVSNDSGTVGKGPRGIEKGDEIWLVDGVGQPMILRKHYQGDGDNDKDNGDGKYRVVGPAFACYTRDLRTFEEGDREVVDGRRWGPVILV